ncbi:Guanyl-specific ribonuclease St (RNase St) [metagenome]|uniref:Guanyl-specific ribonuclease St (RNase St) n=1 Tax=metagenome TaxID=256318 RepID=A0A2P2BW84_9ZZZZ
MTAPSRRALTTLALAVAMALLLWWVQGNQSDNGSADPSTADPGSSAVTGTLDDASGLPVVSVDELPAEAEEMLRLIDEGGPYPESRDGVRFENREGILPDETRGYYHEYTVATPGSDDRGARRIVAGDGGEFYYTDDHYDSFRRIAR